MFSTFAADDVLKKYHVLCSVPESHRIAYKGISMLPSASGSLSSFVLYVCDLSQMPEPTKNCQFVCVCDLPKDEADARMAGRNDLFCVEKEGSISVATLFQDLFHRYLYLQDWTQRLNQIVFEDCDIQKIIDESEEIFKNPLYVLDSSFHMIATSKKYISTDAPWQDELKNDSYHSGGFIRRLETTGRFKLYNQSNGILALTDHLMEPYDIAMKWKRRDGTLSMLAGMSCQNVPLTSYTKELCEVFCDYVFLCDERQYALNPSSANREAHLLQEILDGSLKNPAAIEERAKALSLPYSGPFILYRLSFLDFSNLPLKRICRDLENALKDGMVCYFSGEILVLDRCENLFTDPLELENTQVISAIAETHSGKSFISEPFKTLSDFNVAYKQTAYTKNIIEQLALQDEENPALSLREQDFFNSKKLSYRDVFIRYIYATFMMQHKAETEGVVFVRAIQQLLNYDRENEKNLAEILYEYLGNERNATKTATQMFMSRNNLLYHISKALEIIEMPLDDPNVRHGLMIAYHLLGVYS